MNEFTYFDLIVSKLRQIKVENMKRQDLQSILKNNFLERFF